MTNYLKAFAFFYFITTLFGIAISGFSQEIQLLSVAPELGLVFETRRFWTVGYGLLLYGKLLLVLVAFLLLRFFIIVIGCLRSQGVSNDDLAMMKDAKAFARFYLIATLVGVVITAVVILAFSQSIPLLFFAPELPLLF